MKRLNRVVALFLACTFPYATIANPVGGTVVAGSATITGQGTASTTINQQSHNAIINWQTFSIGAGEVTHFNQPSATASILNRVMSGNPTEIFGMLQGNGRVFVINPNGILVGRGGVVDTHGFMASTRNVTDANFLSGHTLNLFGDSTAGVRNDGSIQALGGDVFLVAHTIENSGTISAPQGTVGLAAGSQVSLVQSGHEHLSVLAGSGSADTGIDNQGVIQAASAELKAAGGNIYSLAINNGGVIRANSLVNEGGRIVLRASGGNIQNTGSLIANKANGNGGEIIVDGGRNAGMPSTVTSSGTVTARGDGAGSRGGTIQMTGDHVGIFDDSIFDASGSHGGGTVQIGGGSSGADPSIQNAQTVTVDAGARIYADATGRGNGGQVTVWSDQSTVLNGNIFARSLGSAGSGGSVEVSSGQQLGITGHAFLQSLHGTSGNLLLDPGPVDINHEASGNNGPNGQHSVFFDDWIVGQLGNGSLTIRTADSTAGGTADLNVNANVNISWNNGNSLTLIGDHSIGIAATATIANAGSGALTLQSPSGSITIGGAINLAGALNVTARDAINYNHNLTAGSILSHSGTDGTGDTSFGDGIQINADTQSYQAGDGPGGNTSGAVVDLINNPPGHPSPQFRATGGSTAPTSFTVEQDGSWTDARTPLVSQFGTATPGSYTLQSDDGTVTVSDGTKFSAGTSLTLSSAGDLTFAGSTALTVAALNAHGGTDGANGHDVLFGTTVVINANSQTYQAGNGSGSATAGPTVDFSTHTPTFHNSSGGATTQPGSFTYRQDANIASGDVPANTEFGNNTYPAALTIQSDNGTVTLPSMTLPGSLTVQANGDITQAGGSSLVVNAGASSFTISGVSGNVKIDQAGNDFSGQTVTVDAVNGGTLNAVTVRNDGVGAITFTAPAAMNSLTLQLGGGASLSDFTVNNNASITAAGEVDFIGNGASKVGGNLGVTTTDGSTYAFDVKQTGNGSLEIDGLATFTAATPTLTFAANVDFSKGANNNFNQVALTANNVDITDAGAIKFENPKTAGHLNVIAGNTVTFEGGGNGSIGTTLTVSSATGGIIEAPSTTLNVIGTTSLTANGGGSISFGNDNDFSGAVTVVNASNVTLRDNNALNVGDVTAGGFVDIHAGGLVDFVGPDASTIGGTLSVTTTAGGINDSGAGSLTVAGAATLTASGAANNVTLDNLNNDFSSVRVVTGNNVALWDKNGIILAGPSTISGTLNVTAGGSISQSGGGLTVNGGASTFTINGVTADILVGTQPNDFGNQTVTFTTTGGGTLHDVSFRNTSTLASFPSLPASLHTLTLQLDNAGVNLPTLTLSGDLNVTAAGLVDFTGAGASSISGNMNITTTAGGITDSGAGSLAVGGTSTLSATGPGNDITLDNVNNDFNIVAVTSGNNVTLWDQNAIVLGGPSTISGTLNVTAGGSISQTGGALTVTAGSSTFTINGVLADILVGSQANDFGAQTVNFNTIGGGQLHDVSFRNVSPLAFIPALPLFTLHSLSIQFDNAAIAMPDFTLTGDLNLVAGGAVTFTGNNFDHVGGNANISGAGITETLNALIVNGTTTLTAGSGNDIFMGNNNDFNTVVINSARNVVVNDAFSGMNFGNVSVNGNLTVTANGLVDFIGSGASTVGGALQISTFGGAINDSGSGSLAVTGPSTFNAAGNNITLDNVGNDFSTVTVNGNNVTLRDASGIILAPSVINGNLSITAAGNITESGALTLSGGSSTFLIDTVTADVLLGGQANNFGSQPVTIGTINGGTVHNLTYRNINALAVTPILPTSVHDLTLIQDNAAVILPGISVGGNLNVIAGGSITDSGNVTVSGASSLAAGFNNIVLTQADDFGGPVNIVSANNVILNDINNLVVAGTVSGSLIMSAGSAITLGPLTVGANLNANSTGTISDAAPITVGGVTSLSAGFGNNILLIHADDFGGAVNIVSANNATINDINSLTVGGVLAGDLNLTAGTTTTFNTLNVGGNLIVVGNGTISESGPVTVAGAASFTAGPGNDISLFFGNDFGGPVTIVSANNVALSDINDLNVGGSIGGSLSASAGASLTVGGTVGVNLNGSAGTSITLNALNVTGNMNLSGNGTISDNANVIVGGTTTLTANSGDITLNNADDFGGAVTVVSANNVTLNDINALTVGGSMAGTLNTTAGGATTFNTLTVGGNMLVQSGATIDFAGAGASSIAGTMNLTSAGDITDSGSGTLAVGGTTVLNAGAGNNVTLDNNNNFNTVDIVSANNVTLSDINSIDIGNSTVSGALTITASSGISGSGTLHVIGTSTLNAGIGDIVLNNANDFGGAVSIVSANNVTLNDINALTFNNVTANGTLSATAGGQVDFAGAGASTIGGGMNIATPAGITDSGAGSLTVNGTATLAAGAGNDITLDNANNNFNTVVLTSARDVTLNDINAINVGNAAVSRNLNVTAGGVVDFVGSGASTVGGALTVTGGGINDSGSGSLAVTGTSTLTAGAGNDLTLDNANDFGGAVTVVSGRNVSLNAVNNLNVTVAASGNLTTTAAGALTVGGSAGGNLNASAGTTVALNAITVAGNANVTGGGDITDNGNVQVAGNATFTTAANHDVILDSAGDSFGGDVNFVATGGGNLNNVTITDSDATGFVINGLTVNQQLKVVAGGTVTQSGGIAADILNVTSSGGSVILGDSGAVPAIPDPRHPPALPTPVAFNNSVNSVSGSAAGNFIFNGHNQNAGSDLVVNNITVNGGTVAIQSDRIDIQGNINANGGTVFLQPITGTIIDVGGISPAGQGDPFVIDSAELHNISANTLVIGSANVNQAAVDPLLHINNAPGNNFDTGGPIDVNFIILPANQFALRSFAEEFAALSSVNIPLPKLEAFNFASAGMSNEEAKRLLPESSIGELFLQLPMRPSMEVLSAKVEENSKWTSGRVAASGSTAGPQTPQ
jgi:filamentous hemagglutinin family protein